MPHSQASRLEFLTQPFSGVLGMLSPICHIPGSSGARMACRWPIGVCLGMGSFAVRVYDWSRRRGLVCIDENILMWQYGVRRPE
jgi:hypothetical protein